MEINENKLRKLAKLSIKRGVNLQNGQDLFDESSNLKNTYFIDTNFRKISKNLIFDVIKSRLDEIIDKLKKQLIVPGFNLNTGINFLIFGNGANLLNIDKYFVNFFGQNVKCIDKSKLREKKDMEKNFLACLGALKIIKDGWETEAIPKRVDKNIEKVGFFAKIFGNH